MPPKTRHQRREQESQGQPATPPTSLPLATRRPRRAAAQPAPAPDAPASSRPQRGRKSRTTPAQPSTEPSAESTSASAGESTTETLPTIEQGAAVITGGPEPDNAVYQNREGPVVSLIPTVVPSPIVVPPRPQALRSRSERRKNAFSFQEAYDNPPLITREAAEPVAPETPQSTLHLLVAGADGDRTVAFTLPATAANALIEELAAKYKPVTDAPKLTLDTGKHEAVHVDNARPAQGPRFDLDNAPSLEDAVKGKVSHPNWSHLRTEYYQQRQDKPGHSQHYRLIEPCYDENGRMMWPQNDDGRRFIPILGDADDSDLDTELDDASSSFKENVPALSEDEQIENIENSEPSDAVVNDPGAGAHIQEEGAIVVQEHNDETFHDAPATQNQETPRSRWALGNIINTASKYIPRLGRVAEGPLPIEDPATPIRTTPPAQHIAPAPRTEPPRPTRTPSASKSNKNQKRAPSVGYYQRHGPPRTKEARDRLNVHRRLEKTKKRKELEQIAVKRAELEAARVRMARELKNLQETKEAREARTKKEMETFVTEQDGVKFRLRTFEKFDRERVKGPLFGPPRAPNAPGSRIKEARAEAKRKRREAEPKVIPGPVGGGYGMNEKYFIYSSDSSSDDLAAESPRAKKARLEGAKDSSLPIGDPFKARPAVGAYFNDEADEPELHGGNSFREVDAAEETAAKAAKAKGSAPRMPPTTPDGKNITNLSGHFTVPYSSESETGSDDDIPTPAPKRSVKESLSEKFEKERAERIARLFPPARTESTESLPPIPPAPTPAHASLPSPRRKWIPPPFFKQGELTMKYIREAQAKSAKQKEEQEKLNAARAKALKHTPRRSSNLRESHLVDSSPSSPSGQSTAKPYAPSGKRVHFADEIISGPSRAASPAAVSEPSKDISRHSPIVSDPSEAVSQSSPASSETAQVITGPSQASPAPAPAFSWSTPTYPTPAQAFSGPAAAFSESSSQAGGNTIVADVDMTRYSKDEMVSLEGMEMRGEILNAALDSIREEDVVFFQNQIRDEYLQFAMENASRMPDVSPRVQAFLDSDACRKAIEEDSGPIAEGIRAGMARDFPL